MNYIVEPERIYITDNGKEVGEVTFCETSKGVYTINHTYVDNSLRGQGVASQLVRRAVEEIESRGGRAEATCSYALVWLARNRGRNIADVPLSCPLPQ